MLLTVLGLTVYAVANDDLPEVVKKTVIQHGNIAQVDEAYSEKDEDDNNIIIYYITLKKGSEYIYLEIDQNGKLIDKSVVTEEEDEYDEF